MKLERSMMLAKRMIGLLDTEATDLASEVYERDISAFTSPEVFALERTEIFGRTPMFLGMSNEIPEPGNYFTRDIVDTPFLVIRHKDGSVRAYLNACRHRGVKVAVVPCGTARRLVCPFHAWTYDLDGKLLGVPESEGFEGMDRTTRGLIALPVAEKYGMIFGCATPGTSFDIDEELGGLGPELSEIGFENYTLYGDPHVHEVHGNWKVAWDTFCENYHFTALHGKTLGNLLYSQRMAFDVYGRNVRVMSAWKSIDEMRQQPEGDWDPEKHLSLQYRLFPSVNFTVLGRFMAVYWIMPGSSPSHCRALHITYVPRLPADEAERASLDQAIYHGCQNVVENEDFWITSLSEPALRSPAMSDTFVFGRNEPALQHFHKLYEAMTGPEPVAVRRAREASVAVSISLASGGKE